MKRDMDIIRKIILAVEESSDITRDVEGVSVENFRYHTMLLKEAGLIKGKVAPPSAMKGASVIPSAAIIKDLTWLGHDFASSIKSDKVWDSSKERLKKAGSWTFDLLFECLKQEAKKRIGLAISS